MDYSIQNLSSYIHVFKSGGNAKYLTDRIKDTIYTISEGNKLTQYQARKLESILHEIVSDQALKWVVYEDLRRKLWDSISRSREEAALSFYAFHGRDTRQLNGINLRQDVYIGRIPEGTELFQWCRLIIVKGGASVFDPLTNKTTVGENFSYRKVPQEQLGISPYSDLTESNGKFEGLAKRMCFQFRFPFAADCMLSAAKGTYDNWSVLERNAHGKVVRDSSGQPQGVPLWTVGGQQQVYIPLGLEQRIQLAKIAQPT